MRCPPYNSIKRTERGAQKPCSRTDYGDFSRRFVLPGLCKPWEIFHDPRTSQHSWGSIR